MRQSGAPLLPRPAAEAPRDFTVTFLDVGQGDATSSRRPAATALVDGGPPAAGDRVEAAGAGSRAARHGRPHPRPGGPSGWLGGSRLTAAGRDAAGWRAFPGRSRASADRGARARHAAPGWSRPRRASASGSGVGCASTCCAARWRAIRFPGTIRTPAPWSSTCLPRARPAVAGRCRERRDGRPSAAAGRGAEGCPSRQRGRGRPWPAGAGAPAAAVIPVGQPTASGTRIPQRWPPCGRRYLASTAPTATATSRSRLRGAAFRSGRGVDLASRRWPTPSPHTCSRATTR